MGMVKQYKATWYSRDGNMVVPFTYPTKPKQYEGYHIGKRHDSEYHVIQEGVVIGMYAGPNGARRFVDRLVAGEVSSSLDVRRKMGEKL